MSKYLFYPFIGQYQDTTCFPVAISNCCIYKNLSIPLIGELIKIAKCEHAGTINEKKCIDYVKLDMIQTIDISKIFEHGGILTVNHPIVNLHSFLIIKDEDETYCIINSWLGPRIMIGVSRNDIEQFLCKKGNINRRGWFFNK